MSRLRSAAPHARSVAGDEVTISYLGREEFAPAAARQAVLQERWGFECTCERCTVEAAAPKELSQAIAGCYARVMQVCVTYVSHTLYYHQRTSARCSCTPMPAGQTGARAAASVACAVGNSAQASRCTGTPPTPPPPPCAQDLRPAFLEAAQSGDGARLSAVTGHLRGVEATGRAAIKEHVTAGVHPATAIFMHAALYDLHELLYASTQLGDLGDDISGGGSSGGGSGSERGHEALAALARCLSIVDTVSRGAELHVFLACALLERASALRGADSPQVREGL